MSDKELILNNLKKLLKYLDEANNFYPVELEALANTYLEDLANVIYKLDEILK